ncbi:SCO7613 C-terminal domain-containing membrane protein [Micromonospora sp. NPDC005299]|uniref:SCO7613 C-terminal domain-containing membrane protein n=1 Tax=Micromonospora sp. NPDC005299 TaxID=3364231 RepID=UPI0036BF33B3
MENTGYPCPGCGAPADLASGCPGCGRPPYPPAAEVVRLDREIAGLAPRVEAARTAYQELADRLSTARQRRAELATRIRLEVPAPRPVAPAPPLRPQPAVVPARPGGAETSTRAVQSLLFVLGGLLLGTAAVVFTAVAWAAFGVAGRALILLAFTALALAAPLVARARGLRGTAETFAAVGLLLVLLDGYAAWSVNLFGVAGWPGSRYAALVGGIGAAVAAGYGRLSRLTVPWFAALLTAQPVLPLAAAAAEPSAAGWALVLTALALGNLVVVVALRRRVGSTGPVGAGANPVAGAGAGGGLAGGGPVQPDPAAGIGGAAAGGGPAAAPPPAPVRPGVPSAPLAGWVLGWVGHGVALALAAGCALVPLALGRAAGTPLLAGGPLLVVALALAAGALAAGGRTYRAVTAGLLVPVLAVALIRPVAALRPGLLLLAAGLVVVGLAGAVRALPAGRRTGPRLGAFLVAAGLGQVATVLTGLVAAATAAAAFPAWQGGRAAAVPSWGWQLPVAVLCTAGAVALLAPRAARPLVGVVGGALTVLAAPAVAATPWPLVLVADLAAATALLLVLVARPRRRYPTAVVTALTAAVLLGHALLVGCAAPAGAGAVLAVLAALGPVVAARGRRGRGAQPVVAGVALAVALLAVPAGVAVALFGLGVPPWWQLRGATAAVAVPVVAVVTVRRHWPDLHGYASTGLAVALAAVGLGPLVVAGGEPVALYAAAGVLLALASGGGARPGPAPQAVGAALAGLALLAAAPIALAVLLDLPVRPWSGVPAVEPAPAAGRAGLVLMLLGAAAATYAWIVTSRAASDAPGRSRRSGGRWLPALAALPFGAVALPVLLAAAGAPWPVVPALVFGTGVAALLLAALAGPRPAAPMVLLPLGFALTVPGLGGLVATRAGTLAGLGVLVVAAAVAGAAGRPAEARLAGWLGAVAAATGFAVTAALAGGLPLRTAGFAVLAVAAVTLHAVPALRTRTAGGPRQPEAVDGARASGPAEPVGAVRAAGPARAGAAVGAVALEAAAQAVALLALLLTGGALRHAAAACVLWGVVVAVRVPRRGETPARRWGLAAVAGGSELLGGWLLLAAGGVAVLEAYTLPAAALALGAGLLALRTRPGLNSWLALGPGLGAALLPSLVSVLAAPDAQPARRLALGLVALGAVLGGAVRRWQAPVLLGAATLVPLALHELARGWDLLPRWIFLGLGGLALIALAATYERRRRDLSRLRAAVGGMR